MKMDQDFTPSPFFTLNQKQNEHAFTEEIVLKTKNKNKLWNSKTGIYAFYKHNDTEAPVTFKRNGIETLIIANANKGIRTMFSEDELDIKENRFVISSDFELPSTGVAVYHQSEFRCGRWNFTGGIRIDYEHDKMQYANEANLHYIFTLLMDDYKKLQTKLNGTAKMDFIEVLPKFAVQYNLNEHNNIYASFAKGYKAGGFNTQIFSDILQTQLKSDMMTDMGMKFDGMNDTSYDISKATSYEPEHNWTFELGCHLTFDGNSNRIKADISAFYIDCRNQQLTVFPHGKNTGRMMANAGESSSVGIESALSLHVNRMDIYTSYGYTYAIFEDFDDGVTDYTGNFLPYAPQHTAAAQVSYTCRIGKKILDDIILTVDWKGTGKIYWNESNTVQQPFYSLYGASVAFSKHDFNFKIWSKNLTDEKYDTFFFTSLGNNFCQSGKPRQMGVTATYSL